MPDFYSNLRSIGLGHLIPAHSKAPVSYNKAIGRRRVSYDTQVSPTSSSVAVWSEYAGISQHNHGSWVPSPSQSRARSELMDSLCNRAQAILIRAYDRDY
jgi:hypothetical protein